MNDCQSAVVVVLHQGVLSSVVQPAGLNLSELNQGLAMQRSRLLEVTTQQAHLAERWANSWQETPVGSWNARPSRPCGMTIPGMC